MESINTNRMSSSSEDAQNAPDRRRSSPKDARVAPDQRMSRATAAEANRALACPPPPHSRSLQLYRPVTLTSRSRRSSLEGRSHCMCLEDVATTHALGAAPVIARASGAATVAHASRVATSTRASGVAAATPCASRVAVARALAWVQPPPHVPRGHSRCSRHGVRA